MSHFNNPISKFFFLFFFLLFAQTVLVDTIGLFPLIIDFLHWFVPIISKIFNIVSYPITVFNNGSGDTTYNWILQLIICLTAFIGAAIWFILARNNTNYERLNYWLIVVLRFFVALTLIEYGLIKIWKLQFPYPSPYRLTQTYGDSSPMGLAWTFLGFSYGYNLFMGIAEVLSALMFWRRTTLLGAIITLFTTVNVMAINYFYDVPVKLFSTTLFIMTLYILSYNLKDLIAFFLTSTPVKLNIQKAFRFRKPIFNKLLIGLKYAILLFLIGGGVVSTIQSHKELNGPKHEVFGYYELQSDSIYQVMNWSKINFVYNDFLRAYDNEGNTIYLEAKVDTIKKTLSFNENVKLNKTWDYIYKLKSDSLILANDSLSSKIIYLRKYPEKSRLMNRGFQWINETPYSY
jgi:hypothetical protein